MSLLIKAIQSGSDEQLDLAIESMLASEIRAELLPYLSRKHDISVWDQYAAAALPAVLAERFGDALTPKEVASDVGNCADAMLEERAKRMKGES